MEDMMEQYNRDMRLAEENREPEEYSTKIEHIDSLYASSHEELIANMKAIDTMSEEEAYEFIKNHHGAILKEIFYAQHEDKSKEFWYLLRTPKFLYILMQVMNEQLPSFEEKIKCNSFIYNFIIYNDADSYIKRLMYMLGENINKYDVMKLMRIEGMTIQLAVFLVASNKSTFKPYLNVRRLNFAIATAPINIMTSKNIMKIYEALYTHVNDLIIATLFDTIIQEEDNKESEWILNNPDVVDVNDSITFTVLSILESLPPYEMTKVLFNLAQAYKYAYDSDRHKCRISLHKLSKNVFPKIDFIINQLEEEGKANNTNIIFP